MISDCKIQLYVDETFRIHDKDKSGTLDKEELAMFLNGVFTLMGHSRRVNQMEAQKALCTMDKSKGSKVTKYELFITVKRLLSEEYDKIGYQKHCWYGEYEEKSSYEGSNRSWESPKFGNTTWGNTENCEQNEQTNEKQKIKKNQGSIDKEWGISNKGGSFDHIQSA